ncbi:hypothetical protein [Streptomyces sp. NPDC052015]
MTHDAKPVAQRMYEACNARDLAAAETIFSVDFVSWAPSASTAP